MNEELQKALTDALTGSIDAATQAKDFVLAELPDVISQLLWWKGVQSFLWFLAGLGLAVWMIYFVKTRKEWLVREYKEEGDFIIPIVIIGSMLPVLSFALVTANLDWLQILIAPKIYLIEYAAWLAR